MMRCKAHPYEKGGVGVCAACLRDRLLALAAVQNEATVPAPPPPPPPAPLPLPSSPPPLLPFPRSVSPYVARRKSDASSTACRRRHHPGLLFFRTPQVGPSANSGFVSEEGMIGAGTFERKRSGKFSVFATLFGQYSKSEHGVHDGEQIPYKSKSKHSWLLGLFFPRGRRRQNRSQAQGPDLACGPATRQAACRVSDRGMSPEAEQEDDVEEEGEEDADVDYSANASPWQPTPSPMRKAETGRQRRFGGGGGGGGLAFCLSPLVRPSPRAHRSVEVGFSGEIGINTRSPHHRHFAGGGEASLRHCRSRKLADVGRFR